MVVEQSLEGLPYDLGESAERQKELLTPDTPDKVKNLVGEFDRLQVVSAKKIVAEKEEELRKIRDKVP